MWRHDGCQRLFGRGRKPGEAVRRFHCGRSHFISDAHRRGVWISGAQRLGKIDHDSNPVRIAASDVRPRDCRRLRRGRIARTDPPQHRIHVAEVFALRRSHGVREFALLCGNVRRARGRVARTDRLGARDGRAARARVEPDRHAGRRMEAAARARLRGAASAADPVSRRADLGRRSALAPAVLGVDSADEQRRRHRSSSPRITWTKPNTATGWR